jgi:dTDP-4-amino-4,6-dideoxygalactose transaminase
MMCLSFQFKKHLNIGRGGMILLDNPEQYEQLLKMRYDGREDDIPWADQDINTLGYHYYMTPEMAQIGLDKLKVARNTKPKLWSWENYPDISKMKVFNAK